jgi:hypothetical protein
MDSYAQTQTKTNKIKESTISMTENLPALGPQ